MNPSSDLRFIFSKQDKNPNCTVLLSRQSQLELRPAKERESSSNDTFNSLKVGVCFEVIKSKIKTQRQITEACRVLSCYFSQYKVLLPGLGGKSSTRQPESATVPVPANICFNSCITPGTAAVVTRTRYSTALAFSGSKVLLFEPHLRLPCVRFRIDLMLPMWT